MLPKDDLSKRLEICRACSEWNPLYAVCLRGHLASSPTGCPLRKFAPLYSAAYDSDDGRIIMIRPLGGCDGCGG